MTVAGDFRRLAERIVDDLLEADPVSATWLGDHRFDGCLPDLSSAGTAALLARIDDHITELDAVDELELDVPHLVDLEILRARLLRSRFELDDLRRHEWDPMAWNPGTALHLLVSRDTTPADERRAALASRVGLVPDLLATARGRLGGMSGIHVETAIAQLAGTGALLDGEVRAFLDDDAVVDEARRAVAEFAAWLEEMRPEATRDPRLGERLYSGVLWHSLEEEATADALLADASDHLAHLADAIADAARDYLGHSAADGEDADLVRRALGEVALRYPITDATVLDEMRSALAEAAEFTRARDLMTVSDVDLQLMDMPAIHRGVAVAYCDAPGPFERPGTPTFVAVAPTPEGWSQERVASFYREYNGVQLHDLAIHEGIPGHVLQLAHAQAHAGPTRARALGRSGVFIEGWAVYAERLMVDSGYAPGTGPRAAAALRLQQLKMQLRMTINAILDVGVHAQGMPEHEAMWLMTQVGFQEEGEAVGKWRRALLTAGQLPTYYVGYRTVSDLVGDLEVLHDEWTPREIHDLVLSHGSIAPRHRRMLLGL